MKPIVECIPNFSVGQNAEAIENISNAIQSVEGVTLLNVDTGFHANRTVFTFAGSPEAVEKAAFLSVEQAVLSIDMRTHQGAHPRIGAVDVFPFVPVAGIEPDELLTLVNRFAQKVWEAFQIPAYFYERSATKPERSALEWLRKGEYEGLKEKIRQPWFTPDVGEPLFNPVSGILITGVRDFLVAFNINLDTKDVQLAHQLAGLIRTSGTKYRKEDGTIVQKPGLLPHLKAIGWYIETFDKVQVSMNLTDFRTTGLAKVFETTKQLAKQLGIEVTGSELIGLVPLEAMLSAGLYYAHQSKLQIPEKDELWLVELAAQKLGLGEVKSFDPQKMVLEWVLKSE